MKKGLIIGCGLFLVFLLGIILYFTDTLYYLNVDNNVSISKAEKMKHSDIYSMRTELDYIIQDDTIYYYSKIHHLWNTKGYFYKSKINSKKVEKVCDVDADHFEFGFIYKNKLYYRETSYDEFAVGRIESHDMEYDVTIKSMDLNTCNTKDIFSYKYKTLDYSDNVKKPEDNILEVYYSTNGEIMNSSKKFTYDLDKETIIKEFDFDELQKDTCYDIDGVIYLSGDVIYQVEEGISIDVLSHNDDYVYYYSNYQDENYIYKLDINKKEIINKELLVGKDFYNYDDDYFYIDKKLYKYNYDTDKLEVVLEKIDEDVKFSKLSVINGKFVFAYIDEGFSFDGDGQTFGSKLFIYDGEGKVIFKENQDEYTNTLRNAIIENNKIYVVYSDGFIKILDLSKM